MDVEPLVRHSEKDWCRPTTVHVPASCFDSFVCFLGMVLGRLPVVYHNGSDSTTRRPKTSIVQIRIEVNLAADTKVQQES